MEKAQAVTTSVIRRQVTRCNESLVSTHNMRATVSRRLGVSRSQASILVTKIVVQLLENGVLEYFDSVGRGTVYRIINVERLQGS